MKTITLEARAKLNLTLDILRRRPDGYHEIATVMQTISLHDDVTVTDGCAAGIVCRCGAGLPEDERNLAYRAAQVFCGAYGVEPRFRIGIEKRIPQGAGMAGGSADAAAVLRALRALLRPDVSEDALCALGARLGSDVPFCIRGGTALAEGRGEVLTPLPDAPRLWAVVCKPEFSISTAALYGRVRAETLRAHPDTAGMLDAIRTGDARGVLSRVGNVFEEVLGAAESEVFVIRDRLRALGAEAAAMTGSGSAVFGLFRDKAAAQAAAEALAPDDTQTFLTRFV